jgi:hypothetical protein
MGMRRNDGHVTVFVSRSIPLNEFFFVGGGLRVLFSYFWASTALCLELLSYMKILG